MKLEVSQLVTSNFYEFLISFKMGVFKASLFPQ